MTTVRSAVIQTTGVSPREDMLARQVELIEQAASQGAQVICLQELSTGPYFCQVEDPSWFSLAEQVPNGPTTTLMCEVAARLGVVLVVPLFEAADGFYYNTAVVIDADGTYLGRYRKVHIPHWNYFFEKYYFKPGNLGFPVFDTKFAKIGVYICYDRHFPEGARALGIAGAEIVFVPVATAGETLDLWYIEQRAHAIANNYFVGTANRVGIEDVGPKEFYGRSYFCGPRGEMIAEAGTTEEVLVADLDLDLIRAVRIPSAYWRDRRPEAYGSLVQQ